MSSKKITGFCMLLIVAMPLFFSVLFSILQKSIQAEMKLRLNTALLQKIEVPVQAVVWVKKNKEILVHGKMFDVKTFTVKNNTMVFTGLYDEDEDELLESLKDFVANNHHSPLNKILSAYFSINAILTLLTYNLAVYSQFSAGKCWRPAAKIPAVYCGTIYQPPRYS